MVNKEIFEKINSIWHARISRKEFISRCLKLGVGAGASIYLFNAMNKYNAYAAIGERRGMREAMFYEPMGDEAVRCRLCPNNCVLSNGQRGFCRVREPVDGKLYTLVYELVCAVHVDPIEKKPMYHVLPGSKSFSIATAGCNSRCKYCQNWTISQRNPEETSNKVLTNQNLVTSAKTQGCDSIAYTYTEPFAFYEYTLEASKLARKNDLLNILVTGGKLNLEPLKEICKVAHCANVDFKGFNDEYLRKTCAQSLDYILRNIKYMVDAGVWVELTNLVVPTMNDDMKTIRAMSKWIYANLGPNVPLHFSRFWPQYKLRTLYPTPTSTLVEAKKTAESEGLHYVYIGNVPGKGFSDTICPNCKNTVIKRSGYRILENKCPGGVCSFCGTRIAGIWNK